MKTLQLNTPYLWYGEIIMPMEDEYFLRNRWNRLLQISKYFMVPNFRVRARGSPRPPKKASENLADINS